MARYEVEDDGIAGLTLALRLRLRGHDIALVPTHRRVDPPEIFTLPAPYRDLFLKSGGALEAVAPQAAAPGRLYVIDGTALQLPAVGQHAPVVSAALGSAAGTEWAMLLRTAADIWSSLRRDRYSSQGTLHALMRRKLRDRRLRELMSVLAADHGVDAGIIGDAAVVLPYLDQTFGRWQFIDGMSALEHSLRERCERLGVQTEGNGGTHMTLENFWAGPFSAPRSWRRRTEAPVSTQALGLPWIGMAAERIAERIGRVGKPVSE